MANGRRVGFKVIWGVFGVTWRVWGGLRWRSGTRMVIEVLWGLKRLAGSWWLWSIEAGEYGYVFFLSIWMISQAVQSVQVCSFKNDKIPSIEGYKRIETTEKLIQALPRVINSTFLFQGLFSCTLACSTPPLFAYSWLAPQLHCMIGLSGGATSRVHNYADGSCNQYSALLYSGLFFPFGVL